ncbi:MAG TPA: PfkB family carbohydrate kinase [Beijerinckiaceae bacterium]
MTRILCIGIATLDQVFALDAMPTAPEKYRAADLVVTTGGTAANAAVAVARLGGDAGFLGELGDDRIGDDIVAGLEREGVDCAGVRRVEGKRSPLSAILVDRAGERIVISHSDPELPGSTERLPDRLPAGVGAVLGDTRWQAGSAHLFGLARAAGVPAVLDADRAPEERPELLELATHVAFSLQGLRDLTGLDDPRAGLAALALPARAFVAVTNGAEGVFFREGGAVVHAPAFPVEAVDTLGAGDVWHGAFALALAEGLDERAAVRFASAAAAIKCTRFGGRDGAPSRAEVEAFLSACDIARVG